MGSACGSLKNDPPQIIPNTNTHHTVLVAKRHAATTVTPSEGQRRGQDDVTISGNLKENSAWFSSQEEEEKQKCKGKLELEPSKEEDVCPTCLEEYMPENPKIMLRCNHHFHLPCIVEWEQRSELCPICNQVMVY